MSDARAPRVARGPAGARRRVLYALLVGVAVSLTMTGLSRVGALAGWETRAVDAFVFLRDRTPAPEIALVLIDDEAFLRMGARQPLPRRDLADLIEVLLRSGARVVALDIVFGTPTAPAEDRALVRTVQQWTRRRPGAIVFASLALAPDGRDGHVESPRFAPDLAGLSGFSNAPRGADGLVRRMTPVLPAAGGGVLPSFALATLAGAAGYTPERLAAALAPGAAGDLRLPVRDGRGRLGGDEPLAVARLREPVWRVHYAGGPGTFTSFPSAPLLALARSGVSPDADNPFRDRIVLVGATFQESRDFYPTPVGPMPGVEIQANMVQTLLGRRALLPPPPGLNLALLLAACLAVALLALWLRPLGVAVASLGLVAVLTVLSYEAYTRGGYWLDVVAPVAGMLLALQADRVLGRRRLRAAFGQFVSPDLLDRVLREGAALGGEVRVLSVLMSDLRGFTTLSERLPPAAISAMMNEYFTEMVEVILARGGYVSDFIGDGILAVFGAPGHDPDHAWHAVQTALAMQDALAALNRRWAEADGRHQPLAMGVAVNTGEAFVGNIGSPKKKKYSVLGDTVNTVSRIEGLNRDLGTGILISGGTLAAVEARVTVRDRGRVTVKGRVQAVEIHELMGAGGEPGGAA